MQHHSYDIAKKGYVNLLLGNHKVTGDGPEMIRARSRFLNGKYYQPLCDALIQEIKIIRPACLIDAGCGEGYYTNQIAQYCDNIYGFDLSKNAVNHAAKCKNNVFYGVASVFHLPVDSACADVILSIFAPINEEENARVLKNDGYFIKVGPGPLHLIELKKFLYDEVYENKPEASLFPSFTLMNEKILEYTIQLQSQEDIYSLFMMTPYYWKTSKAADDRLKHLSELTLTIQFHIEVYKKLI